MKLNILFMNKVLIHSNICSVLQVRSKITEVQHEEKDRPGVKYILVCDPGFHALRIA